MFSLKVVLVLFSIFYAIEGCFLCRDYKFQFGVIDPDSEILFERIGDISGWNRWASIQIPVFPGWDIVAVKVKIHTRLRPSVIYDFAKQLVDVSTRGRSYSRYHITVYGVQKITTLTEPTSTVTTTTPTTTAPSTTTLSITTTTPTPTPIETIPSITTTPTPIETTPSIATTPTPIETTPSITTTPKPIETTPSITTTTTPTPVETTPSIITTTQPIPIETTPSITSTTTTTTI